MTTPPTSMTYASVVSYKSVRIAFILDALNDTKILTGDIGNEYHNAYTTKKIFYRDGPEWGPELDCAICVIIRALYGLKTSTNA